MSKEAKVGLFVVLSFIAVAALIVMVGGPSILQRGYRVNVLFRQVGGLKVKAPVRLAGMEVGRVESMHVVGDKVNVVLWIKEDAKIREDSTITINTLGMIGEKYIEISMGTQSAPPLPPGATVEGVEPVAVSELLARGERIALTLDRAIAALETFLRAKEAKRRLKRITTNIERVSEQLLQFLEKDLPTFSYTVKDVQRGVVEFTTLCAELKKNTRKLSKEFTTFMRSTKGNVEESMRGVRKSVESASSNFSTFVKELDALSKEIAPKLKDTVHDLNIAVKDAREASKNLKDFSHRICAKEGVLAQFLMDKEVALMLKNAVAQLNLLIEDIRKHPWKLLRKAEK